MDKDLESLEPVEIGDARELTKGPYWPHDFEENPDLIYREFP